MDGASLMSKPVLLIVDDDEETLQLLEHDLERKYGNRHRVLAAHSGREALEKLRQLNLKGEPVALLLVDHVKRVAAGVGEGATAVRFIHQYLNATLSGS